MSEGIIPDGFITADEYIEELEDYIKELDGDVELSHTIIQMLQARLTELDENPCACLGCVVEYRASIGEEIQ